MKKLISLLFFALVFFGAGSLFGKYYFITKDVRTLNATVAVETKSGKKGSIPVGTELHFHSSAHRKTKYFVFIELSDSEVAKMVSKDKVNHQRGIRPLASTGENGL